jgi:hypothetical protein
MLVRLAGALPEALDRLTAGRRHRRRTEALQVMPLAPGRASSQLVRALEESHQIEVFSSTRLMTSNHRPISTEAGSVWTPGTDAPVGGAYSLRIVFVPSLGRNGAWRVKVQPEITTSQFTGIAARKMEAEIDLVDGQSFVVSGLGAAKKWPALAEQLFTGSPKQGGDRELIALVTVEWLEPAHAVAVATRR